MAPLRRTLTAGLGQAAARFRRSRTSPQLTERDQRRLRTQLDACLDPRLGGVTIRSRAAEIASWYDSLEPAGRERFFATLVEHYGPDDAVVSAALSRARAATGPGSEAERAAALAELRGVLVPGWERLFELFCGLSGGVKFAVDLRADLLALRRDHPNLGALDDDLRAVLNRVFPPGLLELRRITWDSSAAFLEKLIAYEAVHEITSWDDLKNRLDADRRCYAFVHPGMPDEPLIFVEVALVDGMAAHIGPLLDVAAPLGASAEANTAIFYSISACQAGLAGVNLGDVLIKEVVADLSRALPKLTRFATLSPIPGFRAWLTAEAAGPKGATLLRPDELVRIGETAPEGVSNSGDALALLDNNDWPGQPALAAALREPLLRLCATYLLRVGRNGRAADRVANFHLTNGARVERLNWLANPSPVGLRESYGLMVNYRYDIDRIDANHEAYLAEGRIARSSAVAKLLDG